MSRESNWRIAARGAMALLILGAVAAPAAAQQRRRQASTPEYVVLGHNDLGMHCLSPRFSQMAILPPYNDLIVQVVQRGRPPQLVTSGITLNYKITGNTLVAGKTDFWTFAKPLFGKTLTLGTGLTGNKLTGQLTAKGKVWEATGIPVLPLNDQKVWNPYQPGIVTLIGDGVTRSISVVIPTSDEMNCIKCHADGSSGATNIRTGSMETNVLTLHDQIRRTTLMQRRPVLCASCHSDNALDAKGVSGVPSLSAAMHRRHAALPARNQPTCYDCHPGAKTQCNRSKIEQMGPNGTDPNCQRCHGTLAAVAESLQNGRQPWLQEPTCAQCHGQQYSTGSTLWRKAVGHGGLLCSTCHNSPHAWWPSMRTDDNVQPVKLQGRAGPIGKCSVCHADAKTGEKPPHPDASGGTGVTGGAADGSAAQACSSCHSDGRSGPLPPGHRSIGGSTSGSGAAPPAGGTTSACSSCHSDGRTGPLPPGHRSIGGSTGGPGPAAPAAPPVQACSSCHADGRTGTPPSGHPNIGGSSGSTSNNKARPRRSRERRDD